jgi:hypothetical protein
MYLKSLKRLRHRTGFRLTVWYAGLYLLYTLVLGGLTMCSGVVRSNGITSYCHGTPRDGGLYARGGVAGVQHGWTAMGSPPTSCA